MFAIALIAISQPTLNNSNKVRTLKNEKHVAVVAEAPKLTQAAPPQEQTVAATPEPAPQPAPAPVTPTIPTGSHEDWMSQAGISQSDWPAVDYIVSHESSWNYTAVNSEGATGLCQALPGVKMASIAPDYLSNPVTQLRWCSQYAVSRYGSWWSAYNVWTAQRWW